MIRNDQQLAVAEEKGISFQTVLGGLLDENVAIGLRARLHDLYDEILEYKQIRAGQVREFEISSLDDLGPVLCKVRIAAGITQKELASRLSVTPQMVQKDESRHYEQVGIARAADVLDALGYELTGHVRPRDVPAGWRASETQSGHVVAPERSISNIPDRMPSAKSYRFRDMNKKQFIPSITADNAAMTNHPLETESYVV